MSKILITYHTFTGKTKTLAEAAAEGAKNSGAEVVLKEAAATTVQDLAAADAIIVATPQPFKMLAGETMKLFERLWRDRDKIGQGKPLGVIVCCVNDASASFQAMKSLANHFKLTPSGNWVEVRTAALDTGKEDSYALGAELAKRGGQR